MSGGVVEVVVVYEWGEGVCGCVGVWVWLVVRYVLEMNECMGLTIFGVGDRMRISFEKVRT